MKRDDVRRWAASYRAAQAREQAAHADAGPDAALSIRHALALIALGGRLGTCAARDDAIDRREDEAARAAWNRLRAVLLKRGGAR